MGRSQGSRESRGDRVGFEAAELSSTSQGRGLEERKGHRQRRMLSLPRVTELCSPPPGVAQGKRMFVLDFVLENCVSRLEGETAPGAGVERTHRPAGDFREMLLHPSQT